MHVVRLIHQTLGQQRVQAALDIYNVRPLEVKKHRISSALDKADYGMLWNGSEEGGDVWSECEEY